jgi:hypothetical protein
MRGDDQQHSGMFSYISAELRVTRATGSAERDVKLLMAATIPGGTRRATLGGDRNTQDI